MNLPFVLMKPDRIFFYLLTFVLVLIIFLAPSVGWRIRAFFGARPSGDVNALQAENLSLQAELAQYATVARELPQISNTYLPAMVYSRYPTNARNVFLINIGSREGVASGKAVVAAGASSSYVLIGRIQDVFEDTALVETIFDPGFRMPVRIGSHGYDALFIGGAYPKATSIAKNVPINVGDVVMSADPSLPYGLPLASVSGVAISSDALFQEATLNFAYDAGTLQAVLVEK